MSTMSTMSTAQLTSITSPEPLPTPISSSSPSSNDDDNLKCSMNCYLLTAIILLSLIICFFLLKFSYVYLYKRRRINSVVDIENNANNNNIINDNNISNNNNIIIVGNNSNINNNNNTRMILTTRSNDSVMRMNSTNYLTSPQNALVRNRHTISVRSHPHNYTTSNSNVQHSLLKRTRTTISYIIANNNIKLKNDISVMVENFPLPPPIPISLKSSFIKNNDSTNDDIEDNDSTNDIIKENLKKFNKPWEFVPEMAAKEMNTIKVKNSGRIIEINPEIWSSVVKDACIQTNYPFHVPLPSSEKNNDKGEILNENDNVDNVENKILNAIEEILNFNEKEPINEPILNVDENKNEEKKESISNKKTLKEMKSIENVSVDEESNKESISDRIKKKIRQKKKYLQQQIIHKSQKIEEILEEDYKDGEGFDYFEITILEKEDSKTNIVIGAATKPFPCYRLPGHTEYSIGYHSNTGEIYQNSKYNGWEYGPSWNDVESTIGCGYKPLTGEIYFTFNGLFLGTLFTSEVEYDVLSEKRYYLFPSIGANGKCKIRVNFGEQEFIYKDIYNEKIEEKVIKNEKCESDHGSSSSSDYNDENIIYIKNSINNNNNTDIINPLGKWKDIRLENTNNTTINEKGLENTNTNNNNINEKVWWNTNTINQSGYVM